VVTLGNSFRGDDGVGPFIAKRIKPRNALVVIDASAAFESVAQQVIDCKPEKVVIIDAADFKGEPGEIKELSISEISRCCCVLSTHRLPLNAVLSVIKEDTGAEIRIIGIQISSMSLSEKLSPEVEKSALEIVRYYCSETTKK